MDTKTDYLTSPCSCASEMAKTKQADEATFLKTFCTVSAMSEIYSMCNIVYIKVAP